MQNWQTPIEDFGKIDIEVLKFYFDQTEKRLKHTLEVSDRATNTAYTLLAGLIPSVTIAISTIISNVILKEHSLDKLILPAIITMFFGFFSIKALYKTIKPRSMMQMGSDPTLIIKPDYFANEKYKGENSIKLVINLTIEDYQNRIVFTDEQNAIRVANVAEALNYIKFGFIAFLLYIIIGVVLAC